MTRQPRTRRDSNATPTDLDIKKKSQRGVRLVSFALHWIRAEIYAYVLKNWRMVKVATTKAQRKLRFNLRSVR